MHFLTKVTEFLQIIRRYCCKATPFAWERLNASMRAALTLAISGGFVFEQTDFQAIATGEPDFSRWGGAEVEHWYSLAVVEGNLSAAKAFETWKSREPFIGDDVTPAQIGLHFAHLVGNRQKERLHVGCTFPWKGEQVKVTSFAADGRSLTACAYEREHSRENGYREKVTRRFRITREDIIAERADRKKRKELEKRLHTFTEKGHSAAQILALLGIKSVGQQSRKDYDRLPVKKIEAVLKKLEKESH